MAATSPCLPLEVSSAKPGRLSFRFFALAISLPDRSPSSATLFPSLSLERRRPTLIVVTRYNLSLSVHHLRYRSHRFLSIYLVRRRRTFPFWMQPFARTSRSSRTTGVFVLPHQRVPTRRAPSTSFSTLRSARSARNESLCPSTYQLEKSVARRRVFATRINDSKHRTRCRFPFDLFTRHGEDQSALIRSTYKHFKNAGLPYLSISYLVRSFVRSFVRKIRTKGKRTSEIDTSSDSLKNSVHRLDARSMDQKKQKLPANDVSRYIDESFLRLCLSYRVDPVYPTVLIELSSRRLSATAVCSCPRMQRSRPVKGNATIATQKSRTLILADVLRLSFVSPNCFRYSPSLSLSLSLLPSFVKHPSKKRSYFPKETGILEFLRQTYAHAYAQAVLFLPFNRID